MVRVISSNTWGWKVYVCVCVTERACVSVKSDQVNRVEGDVVTCFGGESSLRVKIGWLAGPERPLFSRMLRLPIVEPIVGPSSCSLSKTKREEDQ